MSALAVAGGPRIDAEPGGMTDEPVSPELALVDPELREAAIGVLAETRPRWSVDPPYLRLVPPLASERPAPVPEPASQASLPVAAAAYAAIVMGRMLAAGFALAIFLILLVTITLLVR